MKCPVCHSEIRDDAVFCSVCGSNIAEAAAIASLDGEPAPGAAASPEQSPGAVPPEPEPEPVPACPFCGELIDPADPFCSSCGARLSAPIRDIEFEQTGSGPALGPDEPGLTQPDFARMAAVPEAPSAPPADPVPAAGPVQGTVPPAAAGPGAPAAVPPKKRMSGGKIAAIVVAAVAVAALAGGGVWFYLDQQHQQQVAEQEARRREQEAASALHDVYIDVSGEGWSTDAGASRLPVRVSGTDLDDTAVDEVQYVDSSGEGVRLRQGSYELSVVASPIAADGAIYQVPDTSIPVEVSTDDPNENIDATSEGSFVLTPIDAAEVTDEQIESAYELAAADDGEGAADADALRDAAVKRRDDAVAEKEAAEAAAAEEAAREARHVVAASYEFYLPAYWDGRVTVEVDGNNVTIRSKAYPRLTVCEVQVQRGTAQFWGDIGRGCMGEVDLGQGHYASVWATNWGYTIGELYMRNSTDPDDYYSLEEATEIVDLQTGGAVTYEQIRDAMIAADAAVSGGSEAIQPYLEAQIVDTIQPL